MGGEERDQYQVLVNPDALREFGLTMDDVHTAVSESNLNATGGYLDQRGANELLVVDRANHQPRRPERDCDHTAGRSPDHFGRRRQSH